MITIVAATYAAVAATYAARDFVAKDSCADDGGMWLETPERCVCTYSQRGVYEDMPTPGQLAHSAECELKPKPTDWTDE